MRNRLSRLWCVDTIVDRFDQEHKKMLEEAKKRDHRLLGNTMQMYFFDQQLSPGSAFWLPDGAKIYNKLVNLIKVRHFSSKDNNEITQLPPRSCLQHQHIIRRNMWWNFLRWNIGSEASMRSFLQTFFLVICTKFRATIRIIGFVEKKTRYFQFY